MERKDKNYCLLYSFIVVTFFWVSASAQDTSRWPNGMPDDSTFFPIAVWLQNPSFAEDYLETGVNLQVGLWKGPTEEQLEDLATAGLPVICRQNDVGLTSQYNDIIVGWLQEPDEPDNAQSNGQGGYDPCVPTDTMIASYNALRAADSTRPVYLNLGQGVSYFEYIGRGTCTAATDMYKDYVKAADVVSFDIYPVTSKYDDVQGNLWYVPRGVDNLREWSNDEKPIWAWIECTRIQSETHKPTPEQVKTEVWMALIHGARGFGYFCHEWYPAFNDHAWLSDPDMKEAITAVNKGVTKVASVLNSPTVENTVTLELDDVSGIGIDFMTKHVSDTLYIFAVGMEDFGSNKATFTIHATTDIISDVIVVGENRHIELTNNTFKDEFDGYVVHHYKIGGVTKDMISGVEKTPILKEFNLEQNYPNPFNPETVIRYNLKIESRVRLTIYDMLGRHVRTLLEKDMPAGTHTVKWDGRDSLDKPVGAGLYLYKIRAGEYTNVRKMLLVK